MKFIFLLLFCPCAFFFGQTVKVLDAENGKPISSARIIMKDQIVYTNDDGLASLNPEEKDYEISAFGYKKEKFKNFSSIIRLKRHYNEIKEVKIIPVDFKSIFKDVLKNYEKRYYSKPSLYDVVIKQKNFDNNKLHLMVVSEAKLWSKNNAHDLSERMYINSELQMQLNKIKYLKKNVSDSIFLGNTNDFMHPFTNDIFLNSELSRVLTHLDKKKAKFSAKILNDEDGERTISFKIKSFAGNIIEGKFRYDTAKKVITYYQSVYLMENLPLKQKISKDRVIFMQKYGLAVITYDFYSRNGVYIPSFARYEIDDYKMYHQSREHTKRAIREIVFSRFEESDKKGLNPKVDFRKNIWENVEVKSDTESNVLLSEEEQDFINKN
ncbi:hypothetical protein [Chryseobacterium sp. Leaf394]|uniref:hypothetical protein n=1 Tax=Chryseobacterium sp. Leaf394 TaxID=1736361 RepID=UPI0006FE0767|nr:hypothetical protein [Chryseobacterium sp. Leaf394]KQS92254.1 hypothetical protein ASG21_07375 [Chryseobacterium sp. Leaf394]